MKQASQPRGDSQARLVLTYYQLNTMLFDSEIQGLSQEIQNLEGQIAAKRAEIERVQTANSKIVEGFALLKEAHALMGHRALETILTQLNEIFSEESPKAEVSKQETKEDSQEDSQGKMQWTQLNPRVWRADDGLTVAYFKKKSLAQDWRKNLELFLGVTALVQKGTTENFDYELRMHLAEEDARFLANNIDVVSPSPAIMNAFPTSYYKKEFKTLLERLNQAQNWDDLSLIREAGEKVGISAKDLYDALTPVQKARIDEVRNQGGMTA